MRPLKYALLALTLTLAACAPSSDDKYPYPPQFLANVPPTAIKPPPRPGSKLYRRDMRMILGNQASLSQEKKDIIMSEDTIRPSMITTPVMGNTFTESRFPNTYFLLEQVGSDAHRICDTMQAYWHLKRPWLADKRVHLYVKPISSGSYPSGHSLTNHLWALVLGDLIPEKRVEFIQRADEIANHRVDGGAHFFFDISTSGLLADRLYYCHLKTSPKFMEALRHAKTEMMRAGLTWDPEVSGPRCVTH